VRRGGGVDPGTPVPQRRRSGGGGGEGSAPSAWFGFSGGGCGSRRWGSVSRGGRRAVCFFSLPFWDERERERSGAEERPREERENRVDP